MLYPNDSSDFTSSIKQSTTSSRKHSRGCDGLRRQPPHFNQTEVKAANQFELLFRAVLANNTQVCTALMVNEGAGARFKEIHVSTFNSDARGCLGNNLEIVNNDTIDN